jgi:phosphatidylinositol alpha-mannosyltransferase
MRIALVSPYALSVFGGVQEQAVAMSRELSSRGHDVLLCSPDSEDTALYDTSAFVEHFGRLVSLPANGSRAPLTLSLAASRALADRLDAFHPSVVHFHEPFAPVLGYSSLRRHRAPSVGTFHRSGGGPAYSLTKPLLKSLAKNVDVAVSVSVMAQQTLRNAVGMSSSVLFNGFDLSRFSSFARTKNESPVLLTIGRLEERKGTRTAIEATLLHNQTHDEKWTLKIIGDGPERQRLQEIAGSASEIEFLGSVSDAEKRQWLRAADVLLCPAIHGESFGLVLLEGMASSTPVVASDIDGYREAAGNCAVLRPPLDVPAWIDGIKKALSGEVSVATAYEHASHWSMASLMDEYEQRYEQAQSIFLSTK